MPGTVKIWWHDGGVTDIRHHDIPVVGEPELGFESLNVTFAAASSGPAPKNATVALVETDVNVRYRVQTPGDPTEADAATSKPLPRTSFWTEPVGIKEGQTISFIEVP